MSQATDSAVPVAQSTVEKSEKVQSASLTKGGSALREGLFGFGCGVFYGAVSAVAGHPFDTIKTKMQAQSGYEKGGSFRAITTVMRTEGARGLWRGLTPPLIGSSIFRSVQFGVYNMMYSTDMGPYWEKEIPFTAGLQVRVVGAGIIASTARALIESPLEYIKVRRQTGQSWRVGATIGESLRHPVREVANLYKGFGVTLARTCGLMGSFFIMVDSCVRHLPDLMDAPLAGPFIKGGVCATVGWMLIWPLENMKSQVQANTGGNNMSALARAGYVVRQPGGVAALYRGWGPGCARSVVANGFSMIAFMWCQDMREKYENQQALGASLALTQRENSGAVPAASSVSESGESN